MIIAKDFYLLRTPLLSLNYLDQFDGLSQAQTIDKLQTVFSDSYLQETIYIASPELYAELQKWLTGGLAEKEVNKLTLALLRYLLRMCSRSTPYGLFAGCAVGQFGETTGIQLGQKDKHRKHCRLDMNYVAELSALIMRSPVVERQLLYFPNNSIYKIGNKYRYAEYEVINKFRSYHLTEVACSNYLEKILAHAFAGATLEALADSITSIDISRSEAEEFIAELLQCQVLVSELQPTVTGREFFLTLISKLQSLRGAGPIAEKLSQINFLLQDQSTGINKYTRAHELVKELLPDTNSKDLVQTDLFLATTQNSISRTVISDLQQQMEKLLPLARAKEHTDLQQFKEAFRTRYEDQEVPLVWALDAESGIGYAGYQNGHADHAPLVDDIVTSDGKPMDSITWTNMSKFQLRKLHECLRESRSEIELTEKDLEEFKTGATTTIPDSMYLMGSILGKSSEEIDRGVYQFELKGFGGPSVATLLGRFCHADDTLNEKVQECLREEEQFNADCIYAEIVHLPEARAGNILMRPQLRAYEIVYLGNGSVDAEHQIPLTDLMLCVQKNRIVLRSKKLNKIVIPRLSTAHNFITGSLPAYKFLCDLQFQDVNSSISWNWNNLNDEKFLPRVKFGKIILSKCKWVLHKKDYPDLLRKNGALNVDIHQLSQTIRQQLRLPQYVVITEGDNELLINLNNESCTAILINTLIKNEKLILQEFLSTIDNCFAGGHGGRFTNEVVIPFKRSTPSTALPPHHSLTLSTQQAARTFIAGSEWLYVKIFCGTNNAERLLKEIIRPLVYQLSQEEIIDRWFFIRFADPEHHIRVRFHHASNNEFWKNVLEALHLALNKYKGNAMPLRVQVDTYEREIERYGMNTMEISEDFFYYDSESVINCIDLLEGAEAEQYRWLLALRGADMLLIDFDYDLEAKATLLKKLQAGFFTEFGGDKLLNNRLNDKYREHTPLIRSFLDENQDAENGIEEAVALFTTRSANNRNLVEKIKQLQATDRAAFGLEKLIPSYLHMFLNRLFLSNQRKHELVIYHYLAKYYDSQIARLNAASKKMNLTPANA